MPINDRTTNRSYALPAYGNLLVEDVARLREALGAIDADVFARYTKAEVDQKIADLIQGAPGALDTLNELAAAMGDDPNFSATVVNALALKAPLASPAFTGEPTAPQAPVDNNSSRLATTAWVIAQAYLKAATAASTYAALAGATFTGNVAVPSLNGGSLGGNRNRIINGNFSVWQRATSYSNPATATFTADRWMIRYDGAGGTRTVSRQAFTLGQSDVPGEPMFFLRVAQTAGSTGGTNLQIEQRILSVQTLAGQQITLSFYARTPDPLPAAVTLPSISLVQWFGTGGSPSSFTQTTVASSVIVGSTWARFSYTFTLASVAGKTLGTNGDDCLILQFNMPPSGAFNLDIARVQLEPGPVATPFEIRPREYERQLCLPFGQWTSFNMQAYGANAAAFLEAPANWYPMRRIPKTAAVLEADPNTTQSTYNADLAYFARLTPYGGSALMRVIATGSAGVVGYRSWLDAELYLPGEAGY